jgi:hypothetical protein
MRVRQLLDKAALEDGILPPDPLTHCFVYELARRCEEDSTFAETTKRTFTTCALYYDQVS